MSFTQKTWEDRLVEFAGRRKLTDVTTQAVQTVDVTRDEGNVSREGTAFSASNMNDLEQRIAEAFSEMSDSLGGIKIYTTLEQLGLPTSGVSVVDIFNALPAYGLAFLDANNELMIIDGPESGSGLLEVFKSDNRNLIRYTKSNSTMTTIEGMWYGEFKWSGGTAFTGWHRVATDTDISALQSSFQAGVDTLYNKCVSRGATPADETPTAIARAIDTIYNNRYSEGYNAGYNAGLAAAPFKGYSFSNTIPASSAATAYVQYPLTGVRTVTISGSCVNQYVNGYININGERVWTRDSAYADHSIPTITRTIDPNGTGTVEVGISAINGNATGINFSISAQI